MLYMGWAGNDDFERIQNEVLDQISKAEIRDITFVYQFSRRACTERGRICNGQRLLEPERPPSDIVDPVHLTEFLDWARETFPSRYSALLVKDHGQGPINGTPQWVELRALRPHTVLMGTGVFLDPKTQRFMPIGSFRQAIERSRHGRVDVLGLDACRLGSVEVAYELQHVATFLVASGMTVLTTGWNYSALLQSLGEEKDSATPQTLARTAVEVSLDFKLTAFDLGSVPKLATAIHTLSQLLLARKDKILPWVMSAFPQTLTDGVHIDELVTSLQKLSIAQSALKDVSSALDGVRLRADRKSTDSPPGVGLFFPTTNGSPSIANYGACQFAIDTSWGEFLGALNHWLLTSPPAPAPSPGTPP